VLALAAAIPLVGTLIGRRVAGPTMSATHLYAVAAAPTGAGKQHPIDCIATLLAAAGAQEHFGPSTFMSASALCNFVARRPLALCCSDEIGAFLAKVNAKGASGHERDITRVLRSLWGVSFTLITMPEWASRETLQVHSPGLSFFGTSTPDELFQALQGEAIENGLLNRFLVLSSKLRTKDSTPALAREVPPELANKCRALYQWYGTDVELIDIKRPVAQKLTQLAWANTAAEKEYLDFANMIDDRIDQDPALRRFSRGRPRPPSDLPPSALPAISSRPPQSLPMTSIGVRASPGSPVSDFMRACWMSRPRPSAPGISNVS
jgi:hypothetical protein